MIKEQFVSFETAKLLKEAGFREHCKCMYFHDKDGGHKLCANLIGDYDVSNDDNYEKNVYGDCYLVPTQALAARWLREVHDIHVVITEEAYVNGINYLWQVFVYNPTTSDCWDDKSTGLYGDNGEYKTYEGALEAGLREAIKLIKK